MYFNKLNYIIENFKINNKILIKKRFLNLLKNHIKLNKHLNLIIRLNGCKGYICNFYISKIFKNYLILNFKNLNISFKFNILFYLINSRITVFKKNESSRILIFLNNSIICKCGSSFYIK